MWFLNSIVSWLTSAEDFFYDAYLEVRAWVYPFYYLSYPLYSLYSAFYYLAYYFSDFNEWVDWAANEVGNILSFSNIYSYFRTYFDYASDAWHWVRDAFYYITGIIDDWWWETKLTVQGWIDTAVQGFQSLLNQLDSLLASLQSEWSNFKAKIPSINEVLSWFTNWWSNTLARVIAWGALTATQISSLVDSAFTARDSFWAGWQDVKNDVTEFFTDPLQWLYDRLETFFDRFW